MPLLRRCLHWIAIGLLGIFAPVVAIAVYRAEKIRARRKRGSVTATPAGETVLRFVPRPVGTHEAGEARVDGGAVVLAFRPRSASAVTRDDPPALTGSR